MYEDMRTDPHHFLRGENDNLTFSGQSNQSIWKRSVLTMFKYIPTALLNSLFDYRLKTNVKRAKFGNRCDYYSNHGGLQEKQQINSFLP